MNVVIIDKNKNASDLISSYLKDFKGINEILCLEDFSNFSSINNSDLIIFDINSNTSDEILKNISAFNNKLLIAISYEINSDLVTKVLDFGIDDFLLKPILKNILEASIKKILSKKEEKIKNLSKVISFFSLKGGIGKSSIAGNLAYEISSDFSKNVCLLDLSQSLESILNFLNIKQTSTNLILSALDKADKNMILSLIPKLKDSNLYGFPVSGNLNKDFINSLINRLKNIFDYIIIDTPAFIDKRSIEILNNSNLIIYTTLLNSLDLTKKAFEIFDKIGYEREKTKILINRYRDDSKNELLQFEKEIKKSIYYKIPNNYLTLSDAIYQKKPLSITNPNANITKSIKNMAFDIINMEFNNSNKRYNDEAFNLLQKRGD